MRTFPWLRRKCMVDLPSFLNCGVGLHPICPYNTANARFLSLSVAIENSFESKVAAILFSKGSQRKVGTHTLREKRGTWEKKNKFIVLILDPVMNKFNKWKYGGGNINDFFTCRAAITHNWLLLRVCLVWKKAIILGVSGGNSDKINVNKLVLTRCRERDGDGCPHETQTASKQYLEKRTQKYCCFVGLSRKRWKVTHILSGILGGQQVLKGKKVIISDIWSMCKIKNWAQLTSQAERIHCVRNNNHLE